MLTTTLPARLPPRSTLIADGKCLTFNIVVSLSVELTELLAPAYRSTDIVNGDEIKRHVECAYARHIAELHSLPYAYWGHPAVNFSMYHLNHLFRLYPEGDVKYLAHLLNRFFSQNVVMQENRTWCPTIRDCLWFSEGHMLVILEL